MIGQLVYSKAGHDKGTLYVIVGEEEEFVYLSDGRLKKPEAPKKKRRKHIQPINQMIDDALRARLAGGATVYPEELMTAIKKYKKGADNQ